MRPLSWPAGCSRNNYPYTITLPLAQIIIHADVNNAGQTPEGTASEAAAAETTELALINSYELQFARATRPQLKTCATESKCGVLLSQPHSIIWRWRLGTHFCNCFTPQAKRLVNCTQRLAFLPTSQVAKAIFFLLLYYPQVKSLLRYSLFFLYFNRTSCTSLSY